MAQQIVPLDLIDRNPYQPRMSEDLAHVEKVARSIAADTLLQMPVARAYVLRKAPGEDETRYQLAFGHTRFRAYEFLSCQGAEWFVENGYPVLDYSAMPLNVLELTDELMFRHAVSENLARKDLDPVEEAAAMRRALDDFGYSSKQVGELFGKSDATVRGLVRLLDLPVEAQAKIRTGEISQGTARQLLSAAPLVKEETLGKIAEEVARNPGRSQDSIAYEIRAQLARAKVVDMGVNGEAGVELWPADWQMRGAYPFGQALVKGWKGVKTFGAHKTPATQVFDNLADMRIHEMEWETIAASYPDWAAAIEYYRQMAEPPTCAECPLRTKFDGHYWCASQACFNNKQAAWLQQYIEAASQKTGIRVYDPGVDGPAAAVVEINRWNYYGNERAEERAAAENEATRARYASADPDLRLALSDEIYYSANWLTGSRRIKVLDVSAAVKEQIAQEAQKKQAIEARSQEEQRLREIGQENRPKTVAFLEQVAVEVFAQAFAEIKSIAPILALFSLSEQEAFGKEPLTRSEKLAQLRRKLADRALDNIVRWDMQMKGPLVAAEHLQGVAATWGVQLPEDWMLMAGRFAGETVAVETEPDGAEAFDDEDEFEEA